jgi:tetratricopeptide (TPR) repeat protein
MGTPSAIRPGDRMSGLAGTTLGIVGPLAAFPFRLAAREVARKGGTLRRGALRGAGTVVFGRRALAGDTARVEAGFEALTAARRRTLSENGFLRLLGLMEAVKNAALSQAELLEKSGLAARDLDRLALFDAFEADRAPFTFRDLILARKYAALARDGAPWAAIARAVHKVPQVGALAALTLDVEAQGIIARRGTWRGEIDGQGTLDLPDAGDAADAAFDAAEALEAAGDLAGAVAWYNRALAADPSDSVAAFNRANCLRDLGRTTEAAQDYARAVKRDPGFVEAWFNLASLMAAAGHTDSARRHLERALALDPAYGDAVFNLAKLEYEAGRVDAARRWWLRYLELDPVSDWARRARNGLQLIALQAMAGGT